MQTQAPQFTFQLELTEAERRAAFAQLARHQTKGLLLGLRVLVGIGLLYHLLHQGLLQPAAWRQTLPAMLATPLFWVPLALLIVLSPPVFSGLLYRQALRNGGMKATNECYTLLVNTAGIVYFTHGKRVATYSYYTATSVLRTGSFLFLMQKNGYLLALPLRLVQNEGQVAAVEAMLRQGVAAARAGLAPSLQNQSEACLWHFAFSFDTLTAQQCVKAMNRGTNSLLLQIIALFFCIAFSTGLIVLLVLWDIHTGTGVGVRLMGLYIFVVLLVVFSRMGGRARVGNLADYLYGPLAVELGHEGIRVYNPQYESFFGWDELTRVKRGPNVALLLRGKSMMAPLPYHAAPPEAVEAALQFAQQHATGHRRTNGGKQYG